MKLCKVYSLEDSHDADPLWQDLLLQMCPDWKSLGPIHRKYWEWGLGLYGLHKLGCIEPGARGLGVGAGLEWPLFYLANRVERVHATDLYAAGLDPTVPENAAKIAPFPYRVESLVFEKRDALDLGYPADTFDFAFSFSSIEHFGGHAGAALAMHEMARVLEPGGVAAIATELMLAGRKHPEFFYANEIEPWIVDAAGLELVEPLDLHVDDELIAKPVHFDYPPGFQGRTGPHTSVLIAGTTFTSIEVFVRKPRDWKPASRWTLARLHARRRAWLSKQHGRQRIPGVIRRGLKKLLRS